jgi:hypothetical protein
MGLRPDIYKPRNEVERLFRRLKGYRRIFSRFEKPDVMYGAFLNFALIVDMVKCQQALAGRRRWVVLGRCGRRRNIYRMG